MVEPVIPSSVPDEEIPCKEVELASASHRKLKRQALFLKGPLPLAWIRENIRCTPDRLLLVLRAHADMGRGREVVLTASVLRDAGIEDRKAGYRAVARLEASGAIIVTRRPGQRHTVRIIGA